MQKWSVVSGAGDADILQRQRKVGSQLNCSLAFEWKGQCRQMSLWNVNVASTQPWDAACYQHMPALRLYAQGGLLMIEEKTCLDRKTEQFREARSSTQHRLLKIRAQKGNRTWGKWVNRILTWSIDCPPKVVHFLHRKYNWWKHGTDC